MAHKKANYWIVTAFPFVEHGSYAFAKKECERLAEKCPDKTFKVIRCKREVEKDSSSAEYIREMESRHAAFMEEVREVLGALVNAEALSDVRATVAGWNGESRPEGPFPDRHPADLRAVLPETTCGAIYILDEAVIAARALLEKMEGK